MILVATTASADELSLTLDDAIRLAKERSFSIARSQRAFEGAQSRYKATKATILPKFDSNIGANQSGIATSGDNVTGLKPQFNTSLGLSLTQPIDIGGVIRRQIRQSELQHSSSEQGLALSELDILLLVQNLYYSALRAQETVRIDAGIVADLISLVETMRQKNSPHLGFLEVELANAKQTLTNSYTSLDLSIDNLKQILRLDPSSEMLLTDVLDYKPLTPEQKSTLERAMEIALSNRPEIRQAQLLIEQSKVSVTSAEDSRKPTLNLQAFSNNNLSGANPGQAFGSPSQYGRSISATLTIPLVYYDWGVLKETKRQAVLALDQAQADLEELRERIGLEVRQSLIAFTSAEQRIMSLPNREQARQSLMQAEAGLMVNPEALAQISVARSNLRLAETAVVDALTDYNLALFQLRRSLGGQM